jgi:hypothetical protein
MVGDESRRFQMSWVNASVEKIVAAVPLDVEQQELLRACLLPELEVIARRQANFEAEAADYYAGEQLWRIEARRLRQSVADLSDYVERLLAQGGFNPAAEELPEHVQEAMDSLFPATPKEV